MQIFAHFYRYLWSFCIFICIYQKIVVPLRAQRFCKIVEQHRRDNQPLIFSENGVVTQVDPFTVAI